MTAFSDTVVVMRSKEKPKKVAIECSDGQTRHFLCKSERRGDLRKVRCWRVDPRNQCTCAVTPAHSPPPVLQDVRMMEFNTLLNRLLARDAEGRRRKLRLRTYAVVCLNETCGLLEWVPGTAGFRYCVGEAYQRRGLPEPMKIVAREGAVYVQMQKEADQPAKMVTTFERQIQSKFPSYFHEWLQSRFPEPTAWFEARLLFTRSAAVWAMVGHVVGLGDRHGDNILVDCTSGECVHVDFDCLFDKGMSLEKAEVVPFRLTPNMQDAMGVTGYEGVFRQVSEVTMSTLRNNRDTLMNVLESFLHDPLVEWSRHSDGAATTRAGDNVGEVSAAAVSHMRRINERLNGVYNQGPRFVTEVKSLHKRASGAAADAAAGTGAGAGAGASSDSDGMDAYKVDAMLPLSVRGQVDQLIAEATSKFNLCQMYLGWMPFL